MPARFIHTADWQLGKPFAGIEDARSRTLVQEERLNVIARIADAARSHAAHFVLIAGDVFDSPNATRPTVSAACRALGQLALPVLLIPGNHDHGGPGSLWDQPFFKREAEALAPNLRVLLTPTPVELDTAVIFPCPLLRRAEPTDLTAWLHSGAALETAPPSKARIILAHGSTQDFATPPDDDDTATPSNRIDLSRLPTDAYDYLALGDWHGTKHVAPKAWYAGTPETDRFPKGSGHNPGNVLAVVAQRSTPPTVTPLKTGRLRWHDLALTLPDDTAVPLLRQTLDDLTGLRTHEDLLRLELSGSLGIEASRQLQDLLETYHARLLRLKLTDNTLLAPTHDEIAALTHQASDPLVAKVATALLARASLTGEDALIARLALRELHAAYHANR